MYNLIGTMAILGSSAVLVTISNVMNRNNTSDAAKFIHQFLNIVAVILIMVNVTINLNVIKTAAGKTGILLTTAFTIFQWTLIIMAGIMVVSLFIGIISQRFAKRPMGGRA